MKMPSHCLKVSEMASFSSEVKNELARIKIEGNLEQIELLAFLRTSSVIADEEGIFFLTHLSATARRITTFLRHMGMESVEVSVKKTYALKKLNQYRIFINADERKQLIRHLNDIIIDEPEEIRAYLRAAFLSQGSVLSPEKGYHLEMVFDEEKEAKRILELFKKFDIEGKITERRGKALFYIKDSQLISDALQVFGAVSTLFKFEDIRVLKDFKNSINRQVNCDSYNADRIIHASIRQRGAIEILANRGLLKDLSPKLIEAASLRMEYPDDSISSLASLCEPPTNKQDMARRLKKLEALAKKSETKEKL